MWPRQSCSHKLLQLINTATTIKLKKLPQQINNHFDINIKSWKLCFSSCFNV